MLYWKTRPEYRRYSLRLFERVTIEDLSAIGYILYTRSIISSYMLIVSFNSWFGSKCTVAYRLYIKALFLFQESSKGRALSKFISSRIVILSQASNSFSSYRGSLLFQTQAQPQDEFTLHLYACFISSHALFYTPPLISIWYMENQSFLAHKEKPWGFFPS